MSDPSEKRLRLWSEKALGELGKTMREVRLAPLDEW